MGLLRSGSIAVQHVQRGCRQRGTVSAAAPPPCWPVQRANGPVQRLPRTG